MAQSLTIPSHLAGGISKKLKPFFKKLLINIFFSAIILSNSFIEVSRCRILPKKQKICLQKFVIENTRLGIPVLLAGKAVPQLYVWRSGGTVSHRLKELKGFEKVPLSGRESKRVSFTVGFDELKEWSILRKYELYPHKLKLMVGRASNDILWQTILEVK